MKAPSISLLPLLLALLLPLCTSWCYKNYLAMQGEVTKMDISPDNAYMAVTSVAQNNVLVYDLSSYNVLLNYSVASSNVASAKFSNDGIYLGVGLSTGGSNGFINLLSGRPPFSSTAIATFTAGGNIADIDFNSANTKLLVCYSNIARYDIYTSYTAIVSAITNITVPNNIIRCKFSANDDIGFIDTNKYLKIFKASNNAVSSNVLAVGNNFKQLDIKNSTTTPIKFLAVGNDTKTFYATDNPVTTMSSVSFSATSSFSNGPMSVVCYSGDLSQYASAGSNSDGRVFLIYDNDTLQRTFNDAINPSNYGLISCQFTRDGSYLFVGSEINSGIAYLYIYKKNCFECALGSYLTTGTTCLSCNAGAGMAACVSCTNATSCTGCITGYYINQTSRLCVKCDYLRPGCSICNSSTVCVECNLYYFLNASKLCQTCSSGHTGCATCTNATLCLTCAPEYYLAAGVCTRCNVSKANCIRCASSTNCTQCQAGFFSNSGSCATCSVSCVSCFNSAANCSACTRGYYLVGNTCTACSSYCMECDPAGTCVDCQAGTFLATGACTLCTLPCDTCSATAGGCLTCVVGYYISGSSCSACSSNCVTCVSGTNCTSCSLNYYLSASNTCLSCSAFAGCATCSLTQCFSCIVGYYLTATNSCLTCATGGCLLCSSSSLCQACAIGYYLTATNTCSTCTANCQSCSGASNTCTSCIPGTYLSTTSCLSCSSNCQTCTGSAACLTCNVGYYLSGTACSSCTSISGCTDCLTSSTCTACQVGKYLTATNTCTDCPSACGTCSSASTCLSCNAGYYLSSPSCLKCTTNCSECTSNSNCLSCNPGFYLNGAVCASCWGVSRGCLTCNSAVCFNCQLGYYLNPSNLCASCQNIANCLYCLSGTSCQTCAQGYYLAAGNAACPACSSALLGCESCSSSTTCLTCAVGYYLNAGSCVACASKCLTCSSAGCLTCAFRYSYSASDCLTCSSLIPHCEACSSASTCIRCFEGFYLNSGNCLSCQGALAGCSYCNSSTVCTTCMAGYYLAGSSCTLCSTTDGCRLCSSAAVCSACSTGYVLSGNTCVTCHSQLPSCVYCTSSTTCVQCLSGYYVNGASCSTCTSALSDCISCSSGTQCEMCEGGYYLSGGACSACTVQGCEVCTALSPTQCVNCFTGYYATGTTTCQACSLTGCLDCSQAATCVTCQLGYYLTSSSTCALCSAINGCTKCSSATTCTECQTLYYLSGGSCTPCSNTLVGCGFCTSPSSCLSCNSGYYLDSSNLCSLCTSLPGCLLCTSMSSCSYCNSGYYLSASSCLTCSAIAQCAQCSSSALCTACISGYVLTSGACVAASTTSSGASGGSGSGSPTAVVKNVKLQSYYISATVLKHILLVSGMSYTQVSSNVMSSVKLYVGTKNTSTLLTINSFEWGKPNELIFYTNNPLDLNVKTLSMMKRLLVGQSVAIDMNSSAQVSQSLLSVILPNLLTDSDLNLGYNLNDPQFYKSFINEVYNTYYYVFGMAVTIILFLNFLIKALCTVTHSSSHGHIMGHIFALKSVSIALYPTFGQYVNYGYGFMTADLPWLNAWLGKLLSNSADYSPLGFKLYYENMTIYCMYWLALVVFLLGLALSYLFFHEGDANKFKLEKDSQYLKRKECSRFKAMNSFLFNFFYFGMVFAGCAALQGSLFNPFNIISLNGSGYVIGIVAFMALMGESFSSAYNDWDFQRLRLFVKAALLSLAHFNPLYIVIVVLTFDICLVVVELKLKWKYVINIKLFVVSQVLVNFSLGMIFYLPDSLFAIYCSAAGVALVVILEIASHYFQKQVELKKYPFFNKEEVLSSDKSSNEDASWKINLEDYTLEKDTAKPQLKEKDLEQNTKYPLIPINDQSQEMITRTTNFRDDPIAPPQAEKNNRRSRRFRDSNKNRQTILNSSWSSFDMNNSF